MAASPPLPNGCSRQTLSSSSSSFTRFSLPSSSSPKSNLSNRKPRTRPITLSHPSSSSSNSPPSSTKRFGRNYSKTEKLYPDPPSTSQKEGCSIPAKNKGIGHGRSVPSAKSRLRKPSLWWRIFFASKKVRSIILLNVITVVYASNIPVLKEVEAIMDPAAFTVARFTVSAIPFIPFVLQARNDTPTRNAGVELGVWLSLGYFMQAIGLLTSDAGRASFISTLTVVVVPLLDGMLGAIVPPFVWFGALMTVTGVALLESSGSPPSIGDFLTFLSAVFFGVHMLRTERISRNTSKDNFLPLLGYEVFVVAFCSLFWYLVGGCFIETAGWNPQCWTWTTSWDSFVSFPWIPALYTGVFSTGFCLWIEMAAMRDVSATETAIIYGLEPLWGAGFAWFLLGERWGTAGWIGAVFVLAGSLTVQIFASLPLDKPAEGAAKRNGHQHAVNKQTERRAEKGED